LPGQVDHRKSRLWLCQRRPETYESMLKLRPIPLPAPEKRLPGQVLNRQVERVERLDTRDRVGFKKKTRALLNLLTHHCHFVKAGNESYLFNHSLASGNSKRRRSTTTQPDEKKTAKEKTDLPKDA
jgi:hypothetical protein